MERDDVFGFLDEEIDPADNAGQANVISILAVINRAVACYNQGYLKKATDLLSSVYTSHKMYLSPTESRKSLYLLVNWLLQSDSIQKANEYLTELSLFERKQSKQMEYRLDHKILLKFYTIIYKMKTAGDRKRHQQLTAELSELLDQVKNLTKQIPSKNARKVFESISHYLRAEMLMLINLNFKEAIDCYEKAYLSLKEDDHEGIRLPKPDILEVDCLPSEIASPDVLRNKVYLRQLKALEQSEGLEHYNNAEQRYLKLRDGKAIVRETEAYLEASLSHALLKFNAAQYHQANRIVTDLVQLVRTSDIFKNHPANITLMINIHYVNALSLEANNQLREAEDEYEVCMNYLTKAFEDTVLSTGLGLAVLISYSRLLQTLNEYDAAEEQLSVFEKAEMKEYPFPALLTLAKLELTKVKMQRKQSANPKEINSQLQKQLIDLRAPFIRKSHLVQGVVTAGLFNLVRKNILFSIKLFRIAIDNINPQNNVQYALSIYLNSLVTLAYAYLVNKLVNSAAITFKDGTLIGNNSQEIAVFKKRIDDTNNKVIHPFTLNYYDDVKAFDQRVLRIWQNQIEAYVNTNQISLAIDKIGEVESKIQGRQAGSNAAAPLDLNAWMGYLKLKILAKLTLGAARRSPYYNQVTQLVIACEKSYGPKRVGNRNLLVSIEDVAYFFKESMDHLRDYCRDTATHHSSSKIVNNAEACIGTFVTLYHRLAESGGIVERESIDRKEYESIKEALPLRREVVERLNEPYSYRQIERRSPEVTINTEVSYSRPPLDEAVEAEILQKGTSYPAHGSLKIDLKNSKYKEQVLLGKEIVEERKFSRQHNEIVVEEVPRYLFTRFEKLSVATCSRPPMRSVVIEEEREQQITLRASSTRRFPAYDPCYLESGITSMPIFPDDELRIEPSSAPQSSIKRTLRSRRFKTLRPQTKCPNNIMGYFSSIEGGRTLFATVHQYLQVKFDRGIDGLKEYLLVCLDNHVGYDLNQLIAENASLDFTVNDIKKSISSANFSSQPEGQLLALSFALRRLLIVVDGDIEAQMTLPKYQSTVELASQRFYAQCFTGSPIYMESDGRGGFSLMHLDERLPEAEIDALPQKLYSNMMHVRGQKEAIERRRVEEERLERQRASVEYLTIDRDSESSVEEEVPAGFEESSSDEQGQSINDASFSDLGTYVETVSLSNREGVYEAPAEVPAHDEGMYTLEVDNSEPSLIGSIERDRGQAAAALGFAGMFPNRAQPQRSSSIIETLPPPASIVDVLVQYV